jgi:hypothetical protein
MIKPRTGEQNLPDESADFIFFAAVLVDCASVEKSMPR